MSGYDQSIGCHLETIAATLEASGDFRLLRRLAPCPPSGVHERSTVRSGLFVDTETTGLDPDTDEIIELAMVPFRYSLDGRILQILTPFEALRDPGRPLPDAVIRLTGITDKMVVGRSIDMAQVVRLTSSADLVIAHNANFDRRFLERLDAGFSRRPWACSMTEVDWRAEGFEGTKLAYLAMGAGFFYDRHRATNDCLAAIELLGRTLPISGRPAMSCLLENARRKQVRVRAVAAPFDKKQELKKRGYRWNDGAGALPKAWYIDVDPEALDEELSFLKLRVYGRDGPITCEEIGAFERFSGRI